MGSGDDARWETIRQFNATYLDGTTVTVVVGLIHRPQVDPTVAFRVTEAGRVVLLEDQRPAEMTVGLQDAVLATVQRPW